MVDEVLASDACPKKKLVLWISGINLRKGGDTCVGGLPIIVDNVIFIEPDPSKLNKALELEKNVCNY
jgi:hypothetical protein